MINTKQKAVTLFQSTDSDAPKLTNKSGSLIALLDACLIDATHEITSHLHKIISSKIYFTICNFITKTKTANAMMSAHLLFPFSGYLKSIQLAT